MERNTRAWLSYFTWIAGLIFFITDSDHFVRFNAMQSIIIWAAATVLSWIPIVGWIVGIAVIIMSIVSAIQAAQGNYFKLPFVGDLAEKACGGR